MSFHYSVVNFILIWQEFKRMKKSKYLGYAISHDEVAVITIRPSVVGFLRKYLICFAPLIALIVYHTFKQLFLHLFNILLSSFVFIPLPVNVNDVASFVSFAIVLVVLYFLSWVLRSTEAQGAIGLSLIIPAVFVAFKMISNPTEDVFRLLTDSIGLYIDVFPIGVLMAVAIMLVRTEIYRRTIKYELKDTGITISGGIWRKQEHSIPYNQIGRVVLEQSLFGRLLNYGTVIPVGVAEWGAEYYTRGVGAGVSGKITAGIGYARTLKEVSRDPLKCLYGIKDPEKIKSVIEKMITAPFRAEIDQVEYLKKIYEEMKK